MRHQDRIKKFVGRQIFTDSQRITFDLPRDYDLESIMIRINGSTTLTVAGTAVRAEAPLQLMKFIALKANGTDILDGTPGIHAHRLGMIRRGQLAPLTPQAAATVSTQPFAATIVLDRAVIDGLRAKDGNFPSRGLSSFQLEIQFDAATACFTGTPTGTIAAGATVDVFVVQSKEFVGPDGKLSLPRVVTRRTHMDIPFPTTNANYQQRLNTGNLFRGLLIRTAGSTTAGEPSNASLNNVKIMKGNEVLFDMSAAAIRDWNAVDFELSSVPTGIYFIDFMQMGGMSGKLTDCLDMRKGEELWAVLDVTGATNTVVSLTQFEYMPYNAKYWGIATQ